MTQLEIIVNLAQCEQGLGIQNMQPLERLNEQGKLLNEDQEGKVQEPTKKKGTLSLPA